MKQIDTSVTPNLPLRLSEIGLRGLRLSVLCGWAELRQQGLTSCLPHVLALILPYPSQRTKSGQYDLTCSKCACAA